MAHILVVDDEETVRMLLRRLLEGAGHEVSEAENSEAALAEMKKRQADVAFCDVQMPGKDGLWLTAELRKAYPTTAVVLATGVSTVPPNISMQHGVLAYIVKPFAKVRILTALDQALQWHDAALKTTPEPLPINLQDTLQEWLDRIDDSLPPPEGDTTLN